METTQQTLMIPWTCELPPAKAQSWFQWPTKSLAGHPLESALAWPKGTLAVLDTAFEKGLSRFCGWDLSAIIEPEPYLCAARVYKRGVLTSLSTTEQISGTYPIHLEPNNFHPSDLQKSGKRLLIDKNVADLWGLPENKLTTHFELTELSKTLETTAKIIEAIKDESPDELYYLIGGGVFCDTAAFAVGLLGRRFVLLPTTLLAMVDACVGGKTGVNYPPYGKNQIGLFQFPEQVSVWTGWLKTLDQRQIRAGLAESYKHALLSGSEALLALFSSADIQKNIKEQLLALIEVKAKVVCQDPGENGLRATLNLGHTFAHALEALSHRRGLEQILHGEAVALGLVFQAILSSKLGHLAEAKLQIILETLKSCHCLVTKQDLALYLGSSDLQDSNLLEALLAAIQHDKKNVTQEQSQWILLEDFGKTATSSKGQFTVAVDKQNIYCSYQSLLELLD